MTSGRSDYAPVYSFRGENVYVIDGEFEPPATGNGIGDYQKNVALPARRNLHSICLTAPPRSV